MEFFRGNMKPLYLLDTNVISELFKPHPNEHLLEYFQQRIGLCVLCAISRQELVYGMEHLPVGKRRDCIYRTLEELFSRMDVLPYDSFASRICGELLARCEKRGFVAPYADTQIASIAISNNMILVTHNLKDFLPLAENSLLKVEDWWG